MQVFVLVLAASALVLAACAAERGVCPRIVPRDEWGARLPKAVAEMLSPVNTVVIHHTYQPAACHTNEDCAAAMRSMQNFHMDDRKWDDIGYSFAVGGDGRVYKGRGWNRVGAHAPPYNFDSVGITLIGDWSAQSPPDNMLDAVQWLIQCGVATGRISPDYQLIGHRQARSTECPGEALYGVIQKWDRWTASPAPPRPHTRAPMAAADLASDMLPSPAPAADVAEVPVVSYDPSTPVPDRDGVEVRQLNKRSLWDRLVHIWQQEAMRQARQDQLDALASS